MELQWKQFAGSSNVIAGNHSKRKRSYACGSALVCSLAGIMQRASAVIKHQRSRLQRLLEFLPGDCIGDLGFDFSWLANGEMYSTKLRNALFRQHIHARKRNRDREEMDAFGANGYFRKPSDFSKFMKLGEFVRDLLAQNETPPS